MSHGSPSILLALPALITCLTGSLSLAQSPSAQSPSAQSPSAQSPSAQSPSAQPFAASSAGELSPQAPLTAQKSQAATFQVDFRVSVTPPAGTRKLQVWLPLPPSDDCQKISDRSLATFPRQVEPQIDSESEFGNTFAYFEFVSPDGAQLIEHRFKVVVHQLNWNVDYASVQQPKRWPDSFEAYRRADPRSKESKDLADVLAEIDQTTEDTDHRTGQLLGAMRWVDQNLTYDHAVASLSAIQPMV